jgi:hypothetical protein
VIPTTIRISGMKIRRAVAVAPRALTAMTTMAIIMKIAIRAPDEGSGGHNIANGWNSCSIIMWGIYHRGGSGESRDLFW